MRTVMVSFWSIWTVGMVALGVWAISSGSHLWPVTWFFTIPVAVGMTIFSWKHFR